MVLHESKIGSEIATKIFPGTEHSALQRSSIFYSSPVIFPATSSAFVQHDAATTTATTGPQSQSQRDPSSHAHQAGVDSFIPSPFSSSSAQANFAAAVGSLRGEFDRQLTTSLDQITHSVMTPLLRHSPRLPTPSTQIQGALPSSASAALLQIVGGSNVLVSYQSPPNRTSSSGQSSPLSPRVP